MVRLIGSPFSLPFPHSIRADLKLHLASTDYGNFLQNEPSPLATTTISEKCTLKMVKEFQYLRANSVEPISKFLDYITYAHFNTFFNGFI